MAFKIGSTTVIPNITTASGSPANANGVEGIEWFDTDDWKLYKYLNGAWREMVSNRPGESIVVRKTDPLYRVTYTQGYMMGGYRNSSPWYNANRTVHSTDVTTNLGDIFTQAGGYVTGGFSDTTGYMFGAWTDNGASTYVCRLNMSTEAAMSMLNMQVSRNQGGEFQDGDNYAGYIHGGGSGWVERLTWSTETFLHIADEDGTDYQNTYQWTMPTGGYGYKSFGSRKMQFSTETWNIFSNACGGQTHSKTLPSKHGRMYVENNGNSTSGTNGDTRRFVSATDTHTGCSSFKTNYGGETNYEVGQDWGYGLGMCGAACQENTSFKSYYHTDSHVMGGTTMQPKGHDGASSGACATRG